MVELVKTRLVALGDIAEFVRGITFKPTDVADGPTDTNVDCLRTKNVQASLDTRDVWAIDPSFVKRPNQYVTEGDILISSANSWNLVGKCSWIPRLERPTAFGGFVTVLRRRDDSVDSRYLFHWFSSDRVQRTIRSFGNQTTNISNLDLKRSASLTVPLPPLDEQRRIAAILDKAEELRTKRRQALAHLDVLIQSVFDDAQKLSEKNAVPLAELCDSIQTGPFGSLLHREDYIQNGVPLINPMHIVSGQVQASPEYSVASTKFEELRSYHLEADDIVLARRGEMGRCALVLAAQLPLLCGTGSMIVRPDSQAVSPRYLQQVLSSPSIRRRLEDASQGVTMSNLNGKILSGLRVRMPKLAIQREFSNRYVAIDRLRVRQRAQLDELDVLFASLQNRAFKAEL